CEEYFVEIGRARQQALGEDAGERGYVHLNKIGEFAIEHALEHFTQSGMIASDGKGSIAAQQVEIANAITIIKILGIAAAKADVVSDRLENAHHLFVQIAAVCQIAAPLSLREAIGDTAGR